MDCLQSCPETGGGSYAPEGCAPAATAGAPETLNKKDNYSKKTRKKTAPKRAKRREYVHSEDLAFARRYLPTFEALSHHELFHYLRFVKGAALGSQHEHIRFAGHLSITWQELDRRFGRNRFHAINNEIGFLESTHWSRDHHYTRGFNLTSEGVAFVDALLRNAADTDYMVDETERKLKKSRNNGRGSRDMNGNNSAWTCEVPSTCYVDVESIQRGMRQLQNIRDHFNGYVPTPDYGIFKKVRRKHYYPHETAKERRWRAEWIRRRMAAMHWLNGEAHSKSLPYGFVATDYVESQAGRLYAETDFHLQNMPREVRKIALAGNWDYDFQNCHYSILQQLARRYGVEVPAIDAYVADTKAVRVSLSRDLGLEIADVKTCLLALIYGARQSHRDEDAIPDTIGLDKAKELYAHPKFSGLAEDVRVAGKAVIERADREAGRGNSKKQSVILNVMGKSISAKEPWRRILAHLVQGIEAKMLHTVNDIYVEEIWLLVHDGWIADRPLDVDAIERDIESETGFKMVVEMEQLDPWKW